MCSGHACLGKVKFIAFPRCVGHLLKALITSRGKKRILISKTAMVGCCKLSLYANGLVMSIWFIFGHD